MSSSWKRRARTLTISAAALLLASTAIAYVSTGKPAGAYEVTTTDWAHPTTTAATDTGPSGLVTTVSLTGQVTVDAATTGATLANNGAAATMFTPNLALTTPSLRWDVAQSKAGGVTCPVSGVCGGLGTVTIAFSQPVTNPVLHLEGLGADTTSGNNATIYHSTYTLAGSSPAGATLGAVSTGATNLTVTGGNEITAANDSSGVNCDSTSDGGGITAKATAGCGSVNITGTVTSLTFNVGIASVIASGAGANTGAAAADAVGFAVSFGQDYSDAPASYNGTQAPAHLVGDLKLGATIDADNVTTANSTTSPFATSGTAVNTAGDNASGADEDAITPPWPTLTTKAIGSSYSVVVPISGASKAGQICGYVDFNHAGTFTATADQACTAFAAGATSVTLTWTVPATTTAGLTYARLRAAYGTGSTQASTPTGLASSGEVEDYALTILPTVTVVKSLPGGAAGTFDLKINGTTLAAGVGNGGTTGGRTVGSAQATLTTPDVVTASDAGTAAIPLTVSEAPSAGNTFTYTTALSCVDGTGAVVATATTTTGTVTIPKSATANGLAQNITCTFTNTGVASMSLVKTANPTTVSAAGQLVTYSFAVKNTGPVTISSLSIADSLSAPAGPALTISCPVTTLTAGATTTCTASYSATQADIDNGVINNSATASGTDPGSKAVTSNPSTAIVNVTQAPVLTLTKSASPTAVTAAGQTVTYSFLVKNTGNVTVTGLSVGDTLTAPAGPALNVACPVTTLAPNASTTCTAT